MINYTEQISLLMEDVVRRTPSLSCIRLEDLLVFGRFGRAAADGAFATCHCLTLPNSEPGYFYWRDRTTGELTRQSEWFITKSPTVTIGGRRIKYLISFVLPRFCDQSLRHARKAHFYPGAADWVGKLDTIVHELYHIDPEQAGLRRITCADGTESGRSHGPHFYQDVARMVTAYLASRPDPALLRFLQHDFNALGSRYGGVAAATFRNFPSFPQRYMERFEMPASEPLVRIERLKPASQPVLYTEDDLHVREFTEQSTRRLTRKGQHRAA
ncbi:MAG: hypothetical protein ABIX28_06555 [Vicinamibacterales bacterium]